MVYGKGINDTHYGWARANDWNYRVYVLWKDMLKRCYSEKYHEKHQTYKDCYCCERWLRLSNFVEDVTKIEGYELWLNHPNERISLDKDIKSNNSNKCYCLENCCFTTIEENTRRAMLTRDYDDIKGEKNPMYGRTGENHPMYGRTGEKHPRARKVVSVDPITKQIVFTWQYKQQATEFYGIDRKTLDYYLKGKAKSGHLYNGFLWYYAEDWQQLNNLI